MKFEDVYAKTHRGEYPSQMKKPQRVLSRRGRWEARAATIAEAGIGAGEVGVSSTRPMEKTQHDPVASQLGEGGAYRAAGPMMDIRSTRDGS